MWLLADGPFFTPSHTNGGQNPQGHPATWRKVRSLPYRWMDFAHESLGKPGWDVGVDPIAEFPQCGDRALNGVENFPR